MGFQIVTVLSYYNKNAVRVVNFKSPVAHTEPILKNMNQLKLPDLGNSIC